MSESRWIVINSEVDVINARLQTRQMAKAAGLPIMDQARISLAVSSLAHVIHMGDSLPGQIVINRIKEGERTGVQVVWMVRPSEDCESILRELNDCSLSMMVDTMEVQASPMSGMCITAVKWSYITTTARGEMDHADP